MAITTRLFKSFTRLLFPIFLLVGGSAVAGSVYLIHTTARPINTRYLVTPDKYGQLSSRAAQVTDESWQNRDGSKSRGWLLRGAEKAPAVILLVDRVPNILKDFDPFFTRKWSFFAPHFIGRSTFRT